MVATEIGQKRAYGKPQSGSWWIVGHSSLIGLCQSCPFGRSRRGQSGPHPWSAEWEEDSSRRGSSPHPISGMRLFQDIARSGKEPAALLLISQS